ncbi:MAG: hypothetical protein KGO92_10965 [Bacteroidota bacterium]|nr:hypothetical protein [Bacteroidota bacterium]
MPNFSFWELCLILFLFLVVASAIFRWAKQIFGFLAYLIRKVFDGKGVS